MKKTIATLATTATLTIAIGSQVPVAPAPVTINEWQAITAMYNEEIALSGGEITAHDYNGDIKKINDVIRARAPKSEEDRVKREALLKKTEARTLLEVIIK